MDTVIPPDVLNQLRDLYAEEVSLEGWFRSEDLYDALNEQGSASMAQVRRILRKAYRAGTLQKERKSVNDELASAMGLLGPGSVWMYRMADAA